MDKKFSGLRDTGQNCYEQNKHQFHFSHHNIDWLTETVRLFSIGYASTSPSLFLAFMYWQGWKVCRKKQAVFYASDGSVVGQIGF